MITPASMRAGICVTDSTPSGCRSLCVAETSTAIVLNAPREHLPVRPARAEDVKPPIRKVQAV